MFRRKIDKSPVNPGLPLGVRDELTEHQLLEHVAIIGSSGGGKTSGPGDAIARFKLKRGDNFLVLMAKDDFGYWHKLCEETGRLKDLIRIRPGFANCNILDYELSHPEGSVEACAQVIDYLVDLAGKTGGNQGEERFWVLSLQKHVRRLIGLQWHAKQRCSFADLYNLCLSAAQNLEEVQSPAWRRGSYNSECLLDMAAKSEVLPHFRDVGIIADYFLKELPALSEKTRSIIDSSFMNLLDKFLSGPLASLVSSDESTFGPTDVLNGGVVLLDIPVLRWKEPAQFIQTAIKIITQRATLRQKNPVRTTTIWQDECQFFLTDHDALISTVGRSSRLADVSLTQSLPTLYSKLGGNEKARHDVAGWLANHGTVFMCRSNDVETNETFSKMCGSSRHTYWNGSSNNSEGYSITGDLWGASQGSVSAGFSEQWQPDLPPQYFSTLSGGGPEHGYTVSCVVYQGGRTFNGNGKTWLPIKFKQRRTNAT